MSFLKETLREFSEDRCTTLAAALAYYAVFSLPPLLAILVAIAAMVFGQHAAEGQVVAQLSGIVGEQTATQLQGMIGDASQSGGTLLATIIGGVTLFIGATGVFAQLQQSMNDVWEVRPDPEGSGVLRTVVKRLLGFVMILVIGVLLLVAVALGAAVSAIGGRATELLGPAGEPILWAINLGVTLLVVTLLFAAMFKTLPDARIAWKDVWVGALVTGLLFVLGKFGLDFYLGRADVGSAFGAAGSLAVLLVWVYYASLIFLFGVEMTQVYARRYGSRIRPVPGAVRVVQDVRYERDVRDERDDGRPRRWRDDEGPPPPL